MALEDRVKALEDEVKVLKNEIQTTLLDIEEQILSHYYPGLYPFAAATPAAPDGKPPSRRAAGRHDGYATQSAPITAADPESGEYAGEELPVNAPDEEVRPSAVPRPLFSEGRQLPKAPTSSEAGTQEPGDSVFSAGELARVSERLTDADNQPPGTPTAESRGHVEPAYEPDVSFVDELLSELFATDPSDESLDDQFQLFPTDGAPQAASFEVGENRDGPSPRGLHQESEKTSRELLRWVDESVALLGKTRTRQAVALYAKTGDLAPPLQARLMELVDACLEKRSNEEDASFKEIIDMLAGLSEILDQESPLG